MLGHLKESSHFFARSTPQEKRQKNDSTDKKVDQRTKNGPKRTKKWTKRNKIVRWFHYICPLVQFWLLFQAGTFFAAFLGGPRHFFSGHLVFFVPLSHIQRDCFVIFPCGVKPSLRINSGSLFYGRKLINHAAAQSTSAHKVQFEISKGRQPSRHRWW